MRARSLANTARENAENCLHCAVSSLVEDQVNAGLAPEQAVADLISALGDLIGHCPDPERRALFVRIALEELAERASSAAAVYDLRDTRPAGRA